MNSAPVLTNAIGKEVLQALGLQSPFITAVRLNLKTGSAVELEVSQLVGGVETINAFEILRRFHLHEQPPSRDPNAMLRILEALVEAQSFVLGFEDDDMQEGIPELLEKLRSGIAVFAEPTV